MNTLLQRSQDIVNQAIADYKPYAIVAMVSGGDDSRTALEVARLLDVPINFILHGITRTGVPETTEHVRQMAREIDARYIEADAGNAYENYVMRKGFFGRGHVAHTYAYHTLKAQPFRTAVSHHIRRGQRGRNVLLLNGVRRQESGNRKNNHISTVNLDPASPRNVWVSLIHHWSKRDCLDFLRERRIERNPVTLLCHRSGECLCGTMQARDEAEEIAAFFPAWGAWWQDIRQRVTARFPWDWGDDLPPRIKARKMREKAIKAGQLDLFDDWLPMCQSCVGRQ